MRQIILIVLLCDKAIRLFTDSACINLSNGGLDTLVERASRSIAEIGVANLRHFSHLTRTLFDREAFASY